MGLGRRRRSSSESSSAGRPHATKVGEQSRSQAAELQNFRTSLNRLTVTDSFALQQWLQLAATGTLAHMTHMHHVVTTAHVSRVLPPLPRAALQIGIAGIAGSTLLVHRQPRRRRLLHQPQRRERSQCLAVA